LTQVRHTGRLLSVLGVGFGLAVTVGNTIAAGILRTPGEIAAQLPSVTLYLAVWVLGGLYALLGAISMAELGTMIPRSGGQYVFARRALGDYAGFIVGWSDWISTSGTAALVSLVIAEYSAQLFPGLAGRNVAVASSVVIFFALLQWRGVRWGSRTQEITAFAKALAFVLLVAGCFFFGKRLESAAPALPLPVGTALLAAFVIAMQSAIYTYDGWTGPIYFSQEVRNPARDIPRGLYGGVLFVMGIYLLWNAGLVYVLPIEEIAGNAFAPGVAAQTLFGKAGETILLAAMVLSLLSGINAYHLMSSRVVFAMAQDRLFTQHAARVNAGGTPTGALAASAGIALIFIWSGTVQQVIAVLAFFFVAQQAMSYLSVFVLRRREPDTPRPHRAWGYPWTTGAALAGSVAFLVGAVAGDTRNSAHALLVLAASYPAYRLTKRMLQTE
jgi:APA family basic amino acid/polyamine antiporter